MAKSGGSNKKVANGLVALSCGAVLAVYTAGYARTRSAVDQFEAQAAERRAADPAPQRIESSRPEFRPLAPDPPPVELARAAPVSAHPERIAVAEAEPAHEATHDATTHEATPEPTPAPAETPAPQPIIASVVKVAAEPAAPVVETKAEPKSEPKAEPKAEIASIPPAPAASAWKDGTYLGWGTSRHGDIQAEVVVEHGRIAAATIAQCRTRYSCNVIEKLPPEVAQRQSPNVDYVSGATQSANAFYFAVVDALSKAK